MYRTAVLLAPVLAITLLESTEAREPHEEWIEFLKGEWTYQYSSLAEDGGALKGEVKYTTAAKRQTLVAKGMEGNDRWVELIGWQPDRKRMVFLGYGSTNDNYWLAEYDELAKDRIAGEISGILPDGRPAKGKAVLERVDEDNFEVHLKMTADGAEVVDTGKFSRKK
jgi:hypothetical protein